MLQVHAMLTASGVSAKEEAFGSTGAGAGLAPHPAVPRPPILVCCSLGVTLERVEERVEERVCVCGVRCVVRVEPAWLRLVLVG
jgi:hypothetical protein